MLEDKILLYTIDIRRLVSLVIVYMLVSQFAYSQNISKTGENSVETRILSLIEDSKKVFTSNASKSDSLITIAFELIEEHNYSDSTVIAEAYHILGKNLVTKNQLSEGIQVLKKSAYLKRKYLPDDHSSLSKTINYIGLSFINSQDYDSAIYYCNLARIPLIENDIWDINLFYVYLNIGIGYSSMGNYNTSLDYFDTVLIVLDKSGLINDSSIISYYHFNYALLTTLTGKLRDANESYEKSADLYRHMYGNNYINLAGINNNKGINSYLAYELSKAELYYKKALEVYKANGIQNDARVAKIYFNLSQISLDMGDYQTSIDYCHAGLGDKPSIDIKLMLYKNIAISYAEIGENDKANKYFNDALKLLKSDNFNPKRKQGIFSKYADFLMDIGNGNPLEYYQKALKAALDLNGNDSKQYAEVLYSIGNYYLKSEQNPDLAIKYFKKSETLFNTINSGNQGDNISIIQEKEAEIGIASSYLMKYKKDRNSSFLMKADTIFTNVLDEIEKISSELTPANKLVLIELVNPVYITAVTNSFELYNITLNEVYLEKVASLIERSKSAALLAEVNSEHALKTSDIPDDIFDFEHETKDEINGLRQLLGNEKLKENPDNIKISYFESQLLELLNDYDSLISEIEVKYPKYYSVKYYNDAISLENIQSNLESDEIILEYMMTDSTVFIMAITDKGFNIKSIPIDSNFYNSLNYIISIKNVDLNKQNLSRFNEFKKHSHTLWKKLIEPQDDMIGSKRIIIIPDGLLGYLPFDILIEYNYESDKINYRDLPFLIRNHPVSYSYSATLKYNTYFEPDKKLTHINILAFAPSYNQETNDGENLSELKFAKTEVLEVVSNHGGNAFIDDKATKENFLSEAASSDILHLAMHTIINDSLPLQSKLVFYNDATDSSSNYMFTHEIYNLDINASMVTLSACNTGSGEFRKGEGIMSLARGFVYAGVPSIVMTLWEAQDATGSKLMDFYYTNLFNGMKKDVALQHAKLSILKDANMANAHPFFWSAYIVNGDTSMIECSDNENNNLNYFIIGIVIFSALLINRYLRKENKNS